MKTLFRLLIILILVSAPLLGQNRIKMVLYGSGAQIAEGDDDFRQVIFFKVPSDFKDSLYLRLYDPDCGGDNDLKYGEWNTTTLFTLKGDSGVAAVASGLAEDGGEILFSKDFGVDDFYNRGWYSFHSFLPSEGELKDGYYYFLLNVFGTGGDDANVYDYFISTRPEKNLPVNGIEYFCYKPTIRLTSADDFASIRFFADEDINSVIINEFDLRNASLKFNTAFRTVVISDVSSQGEWKQHEVTLEELDKNRVCEVAFGQGGESPNDATFKITDQDGNPLPVILPVLAGRKNSRPVISKIVTTLSDCNTLVFDAQKSTDKDGDFLDFYWDFGDGKTAEGSRIAHTYEEMKDYNILLIVTDRSGQVANSSFERFTITVNKPPVAVASEDMIAAPGDKLQFNSAGSIDPDGNLTGYSWEFGDGASAEGQIVEHSYEKPGDYRVLLRVTDDSDSPCNNATDRLKVWVNDSPKANAGDDIKGAIDEQLAFSGERSYDTDGEIIGYTWDFGDGSGGEGMIVTHAYAQPGYYKVTLTVNDDAGVANSSDSDQMEVFVNDPPVPEAGADVVVAIDEIVPYNAGQSKDSDGKLINYKWDFGDGKSADGANVEHAYSAPGKYTVTLTVKDNSGTKNDTESDTRLIIVNDPPVAVAGPDTVITQSLFTFNALKSYDNDGTITKYLWDFGDGSKGEGEGPVHNYSAPGTYTVNLKVIDDTKTSNNNSDDNFTLVVNKKPVADAGRDIVAAPGEELIFDGSGSFDEDGRIEKFEWEFGDGASGDGSSVRHAYEKPGIYMVNLKVSDNTGHPGAIAYDEAKVTINHSPSAIAGNSLKAAPGDKIILDASSSYDIDGTIAGWEWKIEGTGEQFDTPKAEFSIGQPGTYTAKLTVRDNAGVSNSYDNDELKIFINSAPVANAGSDIHTCSTMLTFDASASADPDGDALKYVWDMGDGAEKKEGIKIIHNYDHGGNYPVSLTVSDPHNLANSVSTTSVIVRINQPPVAEAGEDIILCAGTVTLFNAGKSFDPEGGLLAFYWDFGDSTTGEGLNPSKVYNTGGVYKVSLRVEDDSGLPCNFDTDQMVVKVVESPVADAGSDMVVCANTEVKFDGSKSSDFDGVVNGYEWNFGDGETGGGVSPVHIYKNAGTYAVTLTITGDESEGCDNTDTDEITVTVIDAPKASFDCACAYPVNSPLNFDASNSSGGGAELVSYKWDFGDGTSADGINVTHTYQEPGRYLVSLNIQSDSETECNSAIEQKLVVINAAPVADAGEDIYTGAGLEFVLDASASYDKDGSVTKYYWNIGGADTLSGVRTLWKFQQPGRYPVTLTVVDNSGLENRFATDNIYVNVNEAPHAVIKTTENGCAGELISFSGSNSYDNDGAITQYYWDFGDGMTAEGADAEHSFVMEGTYNVKLTVTDSSGTGNDKGITQTLIRINSQPEIKTASKIYGCPGEFIKLKAAGSDPDGDDLTFSWDFGDGSTGNGSNVEHGWASPGKYNVKVTVDDNFGTGCSSSGQDVEVIINSVPLAIMGYLPEEIFTGGAHDAIVLDASKSSDPDGDALTYKWTIDDGTEKYGKKLLHYFTKPGKYLITLTVSDGKGTGCSEASTSMSVEVKSR